MPLPFEKFKALRSQGLSIEQIQKFERGEKPKLISKSPFNPNTPNSQFVQSTPASPTTIQKVGSGIFTGLKQAGQAGVGAVKSIVSTVDQASQLGQKALGRVAGLLGRAVKAPIAALPSTITKPTNDVNQRAGFLGGQIGQALIAPTNTVAEGAVAASKFAKVGKLQPILSGVAKATSNAGTSAALTALQGGSNEQVRNAALLGGGISLLGSAASPFLKASAERSYSKALGATTKDNKVLSEKVIPELLKRNQISLTRSGLYNKAASKAELADEALDAGYAKLPKGAETSWKSVFEKIRQAKDDIQVNGVVMDTGRYQALNAIEKDLFNVVGGSAKEASNPVVSVDVARKVRQILDKTISQKGKVFGLTGKESDALAVKKLAANSIRSELAKEYPDIAKLNKEFTFWSNVRTVVGDTLQRTKSQTSLTGELAADTGAVVGASLGGTVGTAVGAGLFTKLLNSTVKSTAWRTTAAITKHRLANFLASGDIPKATSLLQALQNKTSQAK